MKSVEQILAVLESLSRPDRQWVIERLPDSAKSVLMSGLSNPTASNHGVIYNNDQGGASENNYSQVEYISPTAAANFLASEPLWITVAILQSTHSTWSAQVVKALPTSTRSTVAAMLSDSRPMPVPIVTSLRSTLLQRCVMSPAYTSIEVQSRWRRWLDIIRLRSAA